MSGHATYGPSKLEFVEACPCYQSDPNTSAAAEEGKELHKAFETEDISILQEDEQREAVERCLSYCDSLKQDGTKVEKEVRLRAPLTFGTLDWLGRHEDHVDIADAKFGRVLVSPANVNLQGQAYTYLAFHNNENVKSATVHFLAPRLDDISTCTYYREPHYWTIQERISRAIRNADDPDSKPIPTEKACRYCARKANCPALGQIGLDVVKKAQLGIPSPEFFSPGSLITMEDRARAQLLAPVLVDWADQVKKANAAAVFEDNLDMPGFDLRSRSGGYKVEDAYCLIQELASHFEMDPSLFASCITTTLPKLVDAIGKFSRPGDDKKVIKEEVLRVAGDMVEERAPVRFLQRERKRSIVDIWGEVSASASHILPEPGGTE
jgi:hypothetical protein